MKEIWESDYMVYDVEIAREVKAVPGGWDNPEGMGFGSAVVYEKKRDRYHFFLHNEGREKMIKLLTGQRVVSFNGIKFDSRVVLGNQRAVYPAEGLVMLGSAAWANYDILAEYICARFNLPDVGAAEAKLGDKTIHDGTFNLDALCRNTLSPKYEKTGHGANAPLLYQARKFDELLEYNYNDVRITQNLYEFILKYGYVVDGGQRVTGLFRPGEEVRWTAKKL